MRIWFRAWCSALNRSASLPEAIFQPQLSRAGIDAPRADPKHVIRLPKSASEVRYGHLEPLPSLESQQGEQWRHCACLRRNPGLLPLPAGDSAPSQDYRQFVDPRRPEGERGQSQPSATPERV